MSQLKSQILSRIEKHTNSNSTQIDFDYLVQLQKEQAPSLRSEMLEICVIESFIKLYEDKTLDFLLYQYMGQQYAQEQHRTAA